MPKELWKNSLFSGGLNTEIAASDTKDNDFSESLNCALSRKGNLSSEIALVAKGDDGGSINAHNYMIDEYDGQPPEVRLVPEAGCFTFRHDLSFISGHPADGSLVYELPSDTMAPKFASWDNTSTATPLALSQILTTASDNPNYGYNYILIPYFKWEPGSVDRKLTCGLMLGQSNLNYGGDFFSDYYYADLEFLAEQANHQNSDFETHPFCFWRWRYDLFDMGSWTEEDWDPEMAMTSSGEFWSPIHDSTTFDRLLQTMPKKYRPSFGYIYIDGKLRVYNRNTDMGWEPKTLDLINRSYDVNMRNAEFGDLTTADYYTMSDNPSEGVVWRDAYLRSPSNHGWSRTGGGAFAVNPTGELNIPNAHHLDVLFLEADGASDQTIPENGIYKDMSVGYSFVSHDGQETSVNRADDYTFAGFIYPPIIQVRLIRNNTADQVEEYDFFKWEPWISGVKIYVRYKNLSGWYQMMHIDFDSGRWSMHNNKEGDFWGIDQENGIIGETGQAPWCLEMRDHNGTFPMFNSYPTLPYSANNERKSGDELFPLYSCHAIVGRTAFIGNIVAQHGTHHGDRML